MTVIEKIIDALCRRVFANVRNRNQDLSHLLSGALIYYLGTNSLDMIGSTLKFILLSFDI